MNNYNFTLNLQSLILILFINGRIKNTLIEKSTGHIIITWEITVL